MTLRQCPEPLYADAAGRVVMTGPPASCGRSENRIADAVDWLGGVGPLDDVWDEMVLVDGLVETVRENVTTNRVLEPCRGR